MCSSLWMSATSVGGHSTCKAISSIVPSLLSEAAILAGSPGSSQAPTAPFIHTPVPQKATLRETAVVVCSVLIFCLVVVANLSLAFYSAFFASVTITQRTTAQATGSYHQDPTYAIGYVTFYNGEFSPITIPAGTQLSAHEGKAVVTTQTATVPGIDRSANPPALGEATIPARAVTMGAGGNIDAYSISGPCCASSVLVKNVQTFTGGQDEENYAIVRQRDIDSQITPLRQTIAQSMTTTLRSQVKPGETLVPSVCGPTFTPDHKAGDAAQSVTMTASETCSGLVSNQATLYTYVHRHAPAHYILSTVPKTHILTTMLTPTPAITVAVKGTFVYQFSRGELERMKLRIAGFGKRQASQALHFFPGVAAATIDGISTKSSVPTDSARVSIRVLVPNP